MSTTNSSGRKFVLPISIRYCRHWNIWEAVREIYQNSLDEMSRDENIHGGIGGQLLLQPEEAGLVAEISFLQTLQQSAFPLEEICAGLKPIDIVDNQVEIVELGTRTQRVSGI